MKNWHVCVALCAAISLVACGDDNDGNTLTDTGSDAGADTAMEDGGVDAGDTSMDGIEIAGSYTDDFGGTHVISSEDWLQENGGGTSTFAILTYDNETDTAIAQNGSDNPFSADLFSRFDWLVDGSTLYICQTAYDAETAEAADAVTPADSTDLTGGCSGFAWSILTQ